MSSTLANTHPSTPDETGSMETSHHDHMVGVYADAAELVDGVVDLIAPGFAVGDSAVVVASPLHRRDIATELRRRGVDVDTQVDRGRLYLVDAADLLDSFRGPDGLDRDLFEDGVQALLDEASAGGRRVRIFGEMVTLLWDEGDVTGALELEDLWEDLLRRRPATLLCGYPADAFANDRSTDAFRAVCDRHTEVITTTSLPPEDVRDHARTVALLEHERTVDRNRRSDLEAQRRALEDALSHLREATARRDELLAIVVHDIQSPATIVTNALALVLDAGPELGWEETRALLETAHEAGERIARLTRDILTTAELDAGSFTYDLRPVDIVRVVAAAVEDVRAATGRTVEFHHDLDLPTAFADEVRQRQILGNLLGNALKFSPEGSRIRVSVTRYEDKLAVRVADAGPGIDPADQARLFEPFTRLDGTREVEGSGLGLHSARLLAEGQGGSIWVESNQAQGATFIYTIQTLPDGA